MATNKAIIFFRKVVNQGYPDILSEDTAVATAMPIYVAQLEEEQKSRKNGGSLEKIKRGILLATIDVVKTYPNLSANKLWDLMPAGNMLEPNYERYMVYRDGDRLVQEDDKTGKYEGVSFNTFRQTYCQRARAIPTSDK